MPISSIHKNHPTTRAQQRNFLCGMILSFEDLFWQWWAPFVDLLYLSSHLSKGLLFAKRDIHNLLVLPFLLDRCYPGHDSRFKPGLQSLKPNIRKFKGPFTCAVSIPVPVAIYHQTYTDIQIGFQTQSLHQTVHHSWHNDKHWRWWWRKRPCRWCAQACIPNVLTQVVRCIWYATF